jgi:predicted nucleic acid-binding protein
MDEAQDKLSKLLLFDSNIIQYTAQPKATDAFNEYITDLLSRGFEFAISTVTIFELLRGATIRTEMKMTNLLDRFTKIDITENLLQYAAKLESAYKLENIQPKEIEDGDKIIAATSILSSSIILTANASDFPTPFFKEVERKFITFEVKRERTKTIVVYLLQPQIEITEKRITEIPQ